MGFLIFLSVMGLWGWRGSFPPALESLWRQAAAYLSWAYAACVLLSALRNARVRCPWVPLVGVVLPAACVVGWSVRSGWAEPCQMLVLVPFVRSLALLREQWVQRHRRLGGGSRPVPMVFFLSLAGLILLGAALLMTPGATQRPLSPVDALFLSTSATTVTGLSPVDVSTGMTGFGQLILLLLMQCGALGVMTFSYFVALLIGSGLSLRDRAELAQAVDSARLNEAPRIVAHMVLVTLLFEALGAAGLYHAWRDCPAVPQGQLLWFSIFHAVSGFCNAGITLFPDNMATPAIRPLWGGHACMLLMMAGGSFGFAVYREAGQRLWQRLRGKRPRPQWSTATWLSLRMTLIMVLAGTLLLALVSLLPGQNPHGFSLAESFYNGISARTSGFNISSFADLGPLYLVLICLLMFIGGNPGATSGGVMTGAVALALMELRRILAGQRDVVLHDRRIARSNVERAVCSIALALGWNLLLFLLLCAVENGRGAGCLSLLFETISSFATCGLSVGVTAGLSTAGKGIIMLNMLVGRLGLFSFFLLMLPRPEPELLRCPETHIPL